jgi:hypothetical protein
MQQREVHEKIIVDGKIGYLREPIIRYTYYSLNDFIKKMQIYSSLSAEEIFKFTTAKTNIILKMTFSPFFTFFKMFILRLGFLDGLRGFILEVLYSFYSFLKYAKVWEKPWK